MCEQILNPIGDSLEERLSSMIAQRIRDTRPPNIIVMSEQTFKNLIAEINHRYLKADSMVWFSSEIPARCTSKYMGIEIFRSEDVKLNEFKVS